MKGKGKDNPTFLVLLLFSSSEKIRERGLKLLLEVPELFMYKWNSVTDIKRQDEILFNVPFYVGFYSYKNLSFFILNINRQAWYMIKGKDVICRISEAIFLSFRK